MWANLPNPMQPQTHRNHTDSGMTFMTGHKQSREPAEAGEPGARRRALTWLLVAQDDTKGKSKSRVAGGCKTLGDCTPPATGRAQQTI
jgi:hypothetical protein